MPTPKKVKRLHVEFLIWQALLEIRFYPSYAIAVVPGVEVPKGGNATLCYRKRKVTGVDYDTLLSLKYAEEIADFFGYRSR